MPIQQNAIVFQTFLRHYGDFNGVIQCISGNNPFAAELTSIHPHNNPRLYWIEAVPMMLSFVPPLEPLGGEGEQMEDRRKS